MRPGSIVRRAAACPTVKNGRLDSYASHTPSQRDDSALREPVFHARDWSIRVIAGVIRELTRPLTILARDAAARWRSGFVEGS